MCGRLGHHPGFIMFLEENCQGLGIFPVVNQGLGQHFSIAVRPLGSWLDERQKREGLAVMVGGNEDAGFVEDVGFVVVVAPEGAGLLKIADGLLEFPFLELDEGHVVENGRIGGIVPKRLFQVGFRLFKMTLLDLGIGLLFGEPGSDGGLGGGGASGQNKGYERNEGKFFQH